MPFARLVAHVAHEQLFVGEAPGELFGCGELASAVVAHVDDERVAGREVVEHLVEVACAKLVLEAAAVDVARVVGQHAVAQRAHDAVVGA